MTDRIRVLTVTLERDIREDDLEVVKQAIAMNRHVQDVQEGEPVDIKDHVARVDYQHKQGRIIASVALESDEHFQKEVREAHDKLKARRGY